MTLSDNPLSMLWLLLWAALWLSGGTALAAAVFRLRSNERIIVGAACGWLVQNMLANFLSMLLPVPVGFWLAAGIVFLAGLLAVLRLDRTALRALSVSLPQIAVLGFVILTFFQIARGTAIFDDFAHLSTVSPMAAGDFPPHFPLDPDVLYGYHHFLLLFAAQLMRIGGLAPWSALDAARALSFGLAVMLSAVFARRLTRSMLGGFLGGLMVAFGSGARWLLLLLPPGLVDWLGRSVQMIGSGAGSGETLGAALESVWAVEGAGPIGFPFAFANGIYPAGIVLSHTANGLTGMVVTFLLLLTFNRWRTWAGGLLMVLFIATWGLLGEAELPLIAAGWGLTALVWAIAHKSLRLPRSLWMWLGITAVGILLGLMSGGAWTDILASLPARLSGQAVENSYQTIGFQLGLPAVVSSHLGVLPVFNLAALVVALCELGPVLLVFPLLAAWGVKAYRAGRWYEAAFGATALFSVLMLFVQFTGSTGVRNTPRLYVFMPWLAAFAVPLVWLWAQRRAPAVKAWAAALGAAAVFGGAVMAGISLVAVQRPVYSYFVTPLDVRMAQAQWNRLEPGALVFDSNPFRAPALFGRHTDSNFTWYQSKPEWEALFEEPDPVHLRAGGFRYMYLDNRYLDSLPQVLQASLTGGCGQVVEQFEDNEGNFRRLIDLQNCQ